MLQKGDLPDEAASDPPAGVENKHDEVPRDAVSTEVEETSVAPNAAVSPTDDSMIDAAVDKRPMGENTG